MKLNPEEGKLWARLNAASGVGPRRFQQLLKGFPSLDAALGASPAQWRRLAGIGEEVAAEALRSAGAFDADAELELAARHGARLLGLGEPEYPRRLAELPAPPPLLYVQGELPAGLCVAVVGTRRPSDYGKRLAAEISRDLAQSGVALVSGLARGVDTEALLAACMAGGRCVGVLGSGLARFYPRENAGLARRMLDGGGAVLTQFPMQAGPEPFRFPMRNGVISGLSRGVLVVEGEEDSGSLITAQWALEQGREVFALPGQADQAQARGPNRLIQQGAKLVMDAADLLAEFPDASPPRRAPRAEAPAPQLYGDEALLYAALKGAGAARLEELAATAGLGAPAAAAALTMLEIKGLARQRPGAKVELQP